MKIGLTEERLNRGLTVSEMATEAGVSTSTLQRAEAGQSVHPRNAKAIADYLGLKVTDIWPVEEVAA